MKPVKFLVYALVFPSMVIGGIVAALTSAFDMGADFVENLLRK